MLSNLFRSSQTLIYLGVLWLSFSIFIVLFGLSRPTIITIAWQTESEQDTAGFNIYRSETENGEFVAINPQLIPSKGSPTIGASYSFTDTTVEPGITYYYQLEDVELNNTRERHSIFSGSAERLDWAHILLATTSVVLGLALFTTGIRDSRQI